MGDNWIVVALLITFVGVIFVAAVIDGIHNDK
jgi:hypothetical protein